MSNQSNYQRIALAACFGTFIEWYDFLTFATLAVHFAILFFPADDPVAGLLYSLATFGMGMVVRPLGAVVFGSLGDRYGRRKVFIATIGIMGAATFLVGLLPTFAQWVSGVGVGDWTPKGHSSPQVHPGNFSYYGWAYPSSTTGACA